LTTPTPSREVRGVAWRIELGPDQRLEDETTEHLVEHNQETSVAIRRRFEPDNLPARPVAAYAVDDAGELVGGCVGSTVDVWHWLTVDMMWVRPSHRGQGLGRRLLAAVEEQARERGCRWAKLNTWEFQAPDFYARCGYVIYGRETDFPPGHTNHLMRKDL
jgi:GNAT superfamily N-acetyltransferase